VTVEIQKIGTDDEISQAMSLMRQLRGEMIKDQEFVADVRAQQQQGYELYGAYKDGSLLGLAGIRRQRTMSRGWHLFVDDLVTHSQVQTQGVGRALMDYLSVIAKSEGLGAVYLDSRATAKGFYERLGFTFLTSVPCFKKV
jgi:ribosomal protein S18 acetylase RimI-like enzyme